MKRNRFLALSILACTLLASCNEDDTYVKFGSDKIGHVDGSDTMLTVQRFYESAKTSLGGTIALDKVLEKIAEIEYLGANSENGAKTIKSVDTTNGFDVKAYRTTANLYKEIQKKFEDVLDGTSYLDDDGKFDKEAYKEYVEETLDYEVTNEASSKYLDAEVSEKLGYNYDEYIEKSIIPSLLSGYLYTDYLLGSSKYKGQFSSQYAINLEILKMPYDTSSENYRWNEQLVSVVKNVTNGNSVTESYKFNGSYASDDNSFYTFNSDNDLLVYEVSATEITLKRYGYEANKTVIDNLISSMYELNADKKVAKTSLDDAKTALGTAQPVETLTIDKSSTADEEFYKTVEQMLIARDLWKIDREVILAKNYDYKKDSALYDAMTSSDKSEAETFASTYSSTNSKPMAKVVKEEKIEAQQTKYYTAPEYYTKSDITNVLPTALSDLRGTSAKEISSHLVNFGTDSDSSFLVTKQTNSNPVYLDSSNSYYYVCEVNNNNYYGYYLNSNPLDTKSTYLSKVNYQIEAYQNGSFTTWSYDEATNSYKESEATTYATNPDAFDSIINLVQVSAENVLSDTIKKEAVLALFEKYQLEVNDQDVYDYFNSKYPDYFDDED